MATDTFLTAGVITGTHGLRGEVKVLSKTDFEEKRFKKGAELWLRSAGSTPVKLLKISQARPHKGMWLLMFDGHPSINDVEHWRGMELCVHRDHLESLPEGTYYLYQLIGLRVVADDGSHLGVLRDVLQPGANDVYVVKGDNGREVLLPAIPDCILNVNLAEGRMTVHLMPGLIDEE